jgi:prepilin-type N-terminal cleavage/methylation domain-containing protein
MTINKIAKSFVIKNISIKGQKNHDSGFTLIELIVVVAMVGILAAIAAPSWLGFVAQQRVNKVKDTVFTTLADAQREAKKNKRTYNVAFRYNQTNKASEILVYPGDPQPLANIQSSTTWKAIGQDVGVKPGQVYIYTNLNAAIHNNKSTPNVIATTPGGGTISFDFMGTLIQPDLGSAAANNAIDNSSLGLKIAVAAPSPGGISATGTKNCVIIDTLIGGMRSEKGNKCDT